VCGTPVGTTQQVLSNNPLEILVLTFDAVPRAPAGLYRQQREDCIDMACLDYITALRSSNAHQECRRIEANSFPTTGTKGEQPVLLRFTQWRR
jgi:hypothetical protein